MIGANVQPDGCFRAVFSVGDRRPDLPGGVAQAVSRRKFAPVADADADRRLRPFVAPELEQQVPVAAIDRDGRRLEVI